MHINRLAKSIVGVERIKVRSIAIDGAGALVIDAEPYRARSCRCGKCGRDAPRYDAGRGVRLWRCCDVGGMKAYVRSEAFRVSCPECGIVAREVPWAAHGSRFTYAFEDTCCWCALSMSKVACQKLMRVSWRTVGSICSRVEARLSEARPPVLDGLVRIGVDETSYRKGYKYMTVIVNHDTGAVVWCHDGHGKEVFGEFLSGLTEEQRASIELVSADGARWVDEAMAEWLPGAARCIDTFHVVQWATDLLDEVRKQAWREVARAARKEPARRRGRPRRGEEAPCGKRKAAAVKGLRYPLLKNPENLTERQQAALEMAAISHPRLWRASPPQGGAEARPEATCRPDPQRHPGMAGQGMEEPHSRVRGAAEEDRAASRCHRRDRRERAYQRQGRIGEQQDQGHREDGLRLPQPGQSLRHGHAQMLRAGGAAAGQAI